MAIAAPCEMFFWLNQTWQCKTSKQKSAQVLLVAATTGAVTTAAGVAISPTVTFDSCPQLVVNKNKDGKYVVTGGGISSGLDEALKVVELVTDEMLGGNSGIDVAKKGCN